MDYSNRISRPSVAQFDPENWFTEGDGLLASCVKTRELWTSHRRKFLRTVPTGNLGRLDRPGDWNLLTGFPRASMLHLGYSVEMYLKAGLVKVYVGCSEDMFDRDGKTRFGHKLLSMADEISFGSNGDDRKSFQILEQMIMSDARYPVFVHDGESYSDIANQQTRKIWSSNNFEAFTEVDDDGYLTIRVGGNLRPRITYRLSTVQKCNLETSVDDIRRLVDDTNTQLLAHLYRRLQSNWVKALIYEDGKNKTTRVQG